MKRKQTGREFLWVAKHKLLRGVVFGLMMALPGISGAPMKTDVSLLSSTVGSTKVNTIYTSLFTDSKVTQVQQNVYLNKVVGVGGLTTVGLEFQTNKNSEIVFAGLSIFKPNLHDNEATGLTALEKIATGYEDSSAAFVAAAGSGIRVTETVYVTQASTLDGNLAYQVQSSGVGSMEAGVMGKFCTASVESPALSGHGGIEDLRLQAAQAEGMALENLTTGFQNVEAHVVFSGQYSGLFQAFLQRPE